jgi:hypothetical protein
MSRATDSILVAAGVFLASTGFAGAQAPGAKTMHVRCNIGIPSGLTEPMTMMAQVYRVGRDNLGKYQLQGQTQNLIVAVMPGVGGSGSGVFDTDLEVGADAEYEFKVVPLDKDGYERKDGRYCFVGTETTGGLTGDLYDKTVTLRPGVANEVNVSLKWIPRDQLYKSNFLQVVQDPGRSDYLLSLYVNDPTDIDVLN